jgi:hypothetical protein
LNQAELIGFLYPCPATVTIATLPLGIVLAQFSGGARAG